MAASFAGRIELTIIKLKTSACMTLKKATVLAFFSFFILPANAMWPEPTLSCAEYGKQVNPAALFPLQNTCWHNLEELLDADGSEQQVETASQLNVFCYSLEVPVDIYGRIYARGHDLSEIVIFTIKPEQKQFYPAKGISPAETGTWQRLVKGNRWGFAIKNTEVIFEIGPDICLLSGKDGIKSFQIRIGQKRKPANKPVTLHKAFPAQEVELNEIGSRSSLNLTATHLTLPLKYQGKVFCLTLDFSEGKVLLTPPDYKKETDYSLPSVSCDVAEPDVIAGFKVNRGMAITRVSLYSRQIEWLGVIPDSALSTLMEGGQGAFVVFFEAGVKDGCHFYTVSSKGRILKRALKLKCHECSGSSRFTLDFLNDCAESDSDAEDDDRSLKRRALPLDPEDDNETGVRKRFKAGTGMELPEEIERVRTQLPTNAVLLEQDLKSAGITLDDALVTERCSYGESAGDGIKPFVSEINWQAYEAVKALLVQSHNLSLVLSDESNTYVQWIDSLLYRVTDADGAREAKGESYKFDTVSAFEPYVIYSLLYQLFAYREELAWFIGRHLQVRELMGCSSEEMELVECDAQTLWPDVQAEEMFFERWGQSISVGAFNKIKTDKASSLDEKQESTSLQ
ncbi:hypothetical protein ACWJJH_17725 [Endozoicomonadaceae bacterium StTr2]